MGLGRITTADLITHYSTPFSSTLHLSVGPRLITPPA